MFQEDSRKDSFPFRKSHMRKKGFTSTGCRPDICPSGECLMQSCPLTTKGVIAAECAEDKGKSGETWVFDDTDDSLNQPNQGPA